ncbi:MAG: hypothetical protein LBP88_08285 [Treponema sp.]|jgi:hypothetical protein|nr:hypothetical protein [Treponema sp.]
MMIHAIVYTHAIASMGYVTGTARDKKMSLPVAPLEYIYAQFEHVSGIHAPEGIQGVPITKLKILDCLIEQLSKMKRTQEPLPGPLSDAHIDGLIEKYEQQIYQSVKAGMAPTPYRQVPAVPRGMIFDLVA